MTMHEGHRQRMRERFRREGLEGFAPHEVLELLLYYARLQGNTNPLAHRLLETFGSLHGVLEADVEQLRAVPGIGEQAATLLALMLPVFRRYSRSVCEERRALRSRAEASAYCVSLLAGLRSEHLYLVSLNAGMERVGMRLIARGSLTEVSAYPRLVAEAALNHNAHSVLLCHNHPGGQLRPSPEDIALTLHLQRMLEMLEIVLLDHVIVADGAAYSMAQHGDLAPDAVQAVPAVSKATAADSTGKVPPVRECARRNPPEA